ncbi:uncharacterized protein FIBRA_04312 [Fibroporia radiculosa]|uniref:Uncharacterized protein n=1 Tax=Fibroporia radiculosa TaxID=599839 RepID=J4HWG7_9APHY|nr:uncharacterized protein FIBRA_04312 [Fibroporia radiculosa]CCM02232.1 predicted protein [Fibroporia radiculosa]
MLRIVLLSARRIWAPRDCTLELPRWGPDRPAWRTRRGVRVALVLLVLLVIVPLALRASWSPRLREKAWAVFGAPADLPPLYEAYHDHELDVSRLAGDPPGAKYLYFDSHVRGVGWGNAMQELLLHSYLAYRAGRTFVWYNYTWSDDGSKWSYYKGKPIPSRIPLSALINGPIVGGPVFTDANAPAPVSIAQDHFNDICPESARKTIKNDDVMALLGHESTAGSLVEKWAEVLSTVDAKCVQVPRDSWAVFDIWCAPRSRPHRACS